MRNRLSIFGAVCTLFLISNLVQAQQASLTLTNCDAKFCYTHNNTWELTKTGELTGSDLVKWTIIATKDTSAAPTFAVHGGLTIRNTGSAPADIGNIVINLQKPNSPKKGSNASHVSIAANVADATNGDGATIANILAAATQENAATNLSWGVNNYTATTVQGTFKETAGSGSLEFTDASNNTVWSITQLNDRTIGVGHSVTLLYSATFQVAALPPAGTPLRVEAIVTFGNAGGRGGSGASGTITNYDNGNKPGTPISTLNVRSVPCRVSMGSRPALPEECNDTVVVDDPYSGVTTTGSVTADDPLGFDDQFPAVINVSYSWIVTVDVDGGDDGGTVCNTATLDGIECGGTLNVIVGYDINNAPIYATYTCDEAADKSATDCVDVPGLNPPPPPPIFGNFCTYSQGGYGGPHAQARLANVTFPVSVGGTKSMKFDGWKNVQNYLPAGKKASFLTTDLVNPTSTSSGVFGGQVLTLKLNLRNNPGMGLLYYCNPADSLHGKTVNQILADMETAIGGGLLPLGHTYSSLNDLADNLNTQTFHECVLGWFAKNHLRPTTCVD